MNAIIFTENCNESINLNAVALHKVKHDYNGEPGTGILVFVVSVLICYMYMDSSSLQHVIKSRLMKTTLP